MTDKEVKDKQDENKELSLPEKLLETFKSSPTNQILFGLASGWISGYVVIKIGKTAALALGGGIIILQVANNKGFIDVNWNKVSNKIDKVSEDVKKKVDNKTGFWRKNVIDLVISNKEVSSAFCGGFLIGLASN
ncbi:unnamed protein product [Brassicogethes aeneus]|uniref:FUN14 domain-containing protein 1 n=1 Tax=Brassicogethes aeneus TaxID=1431903 RepID=A0A9P0BHX9_BRAAE|nr:unnamed protein product [Brassicogethes aeneus]